ncbi:hypothetical protein BOX15_Mlig014847g4 [Macrostomum lignano]|uniref:Protein kinase domain-containing protein n=1 Tax=Macrostomum lignano TaxID=282301 RepID=A0A267FRU1_9PLAT|nr:hypothetical protein BOX15_Mlig014847g4 [Macrostomum lignano]
MRFLHEGAPCDRLPPDLKSSNILLKHAMPPPQADAESIDDLAEHERQRDWLLNRQVLLISDFGLAKQCCITLPDVEPATAANDDSATSSAVAAAAAAAADQTGGPGGVGTHAYMSPEQLRGQCPYTWHADVWSYGVVLWELLTGEVPYANLLPYQIMYNVARGLFRLPIPDGCPVGFRRLLEDCWSEAPEGRPAFAEVLHRLKDIASVGFDDFDELQADWRQQVQAAFDQLRDKERQLEEKDRQLVDAELRMRMLEQRIAEQQRQHEIEVLSRELTISLLQVQLQSSTAAAAAYAAQHTPPKPPRRSTFRRHGGLSFLRSSAGAGGNHSVPNSHPVAPSNGDAAGNVSIDIPADGGASLNISQPTDVKHLFHVSHEQLSFAGFGGGGGSLMSQSGCGVGLFDSPAVQQPPPPPPPLQRQEKSCPSNKQHSLRAWGGKSSSRQQQAKEHSSARRGFFGGLHSSLRFASRSAPDLPEKCQPLGSRSGSKREKKDGGATPAVRRPHQSLLSRLREALARRPAARGRLPAWAAPAVLLAAPVLHADVRLACLPADLRPPISSVDELDGDGDGGEGGEEESTNSPRVLTEAGGDSAGAAAALLSVRAASVRSGSASLPRRFRAQSSDTESHPHHRQQHPARHVTFDDETDAEQAGSTYLRPPPRRKRSSSGSGHEELCEIGCGSAGAAESLERPYQLDLLVRRRQAEMAVSAAAAAATTPATSSAEAVAAAVEDPDCPASPDDEDPPPPSFVIRQTPSDSTGYGSAVGNTPTHPDEGDDDKNSCV